MSAPSRWGFVERSLGEAQVEGFRIPVNPEVDPLPAKEEV